MRSASEREQAVAELLPEVYGARRRSSVHRGLRRREGSTVYYRLTSPQVAELLAVARTILTTVLAGQAELLADLRAPA